jgi:hypothetical protein
MQIFLHVFYIKDLNINWKIYIFILFNKSRMIYVDKWKQKYQQKNQENDIDENLTIQVIYSVIFNRFIY